MEKQHMWNLTKQADLQLPCKGIKLQVSKSGGALRGAGEDEMEEVAEWKDTVGGSDQQGGSADLRSDKYPFGWMNSSIHRGSQF